MARDQVRMLGDDDHMLVRASKYVPCCFCVADGFEIMKKSEFLSLSFIKSEKKLFKRFKHDVHL